jgi:hypothetical protein
MEFGIGERKQKKLNPLKFNLSIPLKITNTKPKTASVNYSRDNI